MFRTSDIIMFTVIVASAAFTYNTKHQAENRLSEIRKLEAQIRYEEDTIDVLKADWSMLTQPARLQRLAENYALALDLHPTEATQIVDIRALPEKELTIEDLVNEPGGVAATTTQDDLVTGSVVQ